MMRERLESQARIVWKSFLGALPVICFYLFLFCTVLALFGTQYIMVVSLVTVLFQTNYRKRKSWASLVRAAAAQLGLGLLAWIATWSFPLSVGLNLIVPFALVFLKATRFNKMGYFSGLMTFTFLQLLPVDLAGFFVQTGAMLYSLACFFLLVKLYQRRYPQEKSYRREQEGLAILADTPFWEKAARTALEERGDELLGEAGEGEDELHISVRNFLHPFLILLRKFDEGERDEAGPSWPMPWHQRPLGKLLYQMRPDGFETRFALRMSAVLTISFLFVHISGADHAYWLPLNAFLLLRPMYGGQPLPDADPVPGNSGRLHHHEPALSRTARDAGAFRPGGAHGHLHVHCHAGDLCACGLCDLLCPVHGDPGHGGGDGHRAQDGLCDRRCLPRPCDQPLFLPHEHGTAVPVQSHRGLPHASHVS